MNDRKIKWLINLAYFGVPAALLLIYAVSGKPVPEAITYWLSEPKRAELKAKYPLTGAEGVASVVHRHLLMEVSCFDTFSDRYIADTLSQIWLLEAPNSEVAALRSGYRLDMGENQSGSHDFLRESNPTSCEVPSLTGNIADLNVDDKISVKGTCNRRAYAIEVLRDIYGPIYAWNDNDNDEALEIQKAYDVQCKVAIKKISNCLNKDYGTYIPIYIKKARLGLSLEYNFCDNPRLEAFRAEVFGRWSDEASQKE